MSPCVSVSPALSCTYKCNVFGEEFQIPEWVKGIASFWVEGNISDAEFGKAIQFLFEHEIIQIEGYGKIDILEKESISVSLVVATDKEIYTTNEKMEINGTLQNNEEGNIVILLINPDNEIVTIKQIPHNGSGEFTTSIVVGIQPAMIEDGNYILRVQYQGEKVETTISYNVS